MHLRALGYVFSTGLVAARLTLKLCIFIDLNYDEVELRW